MLQAYLVSNTVMDLRFACCKSCPFWDSSKTFMLQGLAIFKIDVGNSPHLTLDIYM